MSGSSLRLIEHTHRKILQLVSLMNFEIGNTFIADMITISLTALIPKQRLFSELIEYLQKYNSP